MPRGGKWFSSREENLCDTLGAIEPGDFESQEIPEYIDVDIRLPWGPARLNVTFKDGNVWGKVSVRPDRLQTAVWKPPAYSHAVFEQDTRATFPSMFYIPIEVPGSATDPKTATDPKPRSSRRTSPSRPSHAEDDWNHGDRPTWKYDGRNQYSDEDWEALHRLQGENKK